MWHAKSVVLWGGELCDAICVIAMRYIVLSDVCGVLFDSWMRSYFSARSNGGSQSEDNPLEGDSTPAIPLLLRSLASESTPCTKQ